MPKGVSLCPTQEAQSILRACQWKADAAGLGTSHPIMRLLEPFTSKVPKLVLRN